MPAYFKRLTLSFFAASTLFLWVPLYALYLSLADINFSINSFFVFSLVITILVGFVFFLADLLLTFLRLRWLASGALYFLIFWSSLSGLLLPLAGQAGMISPEDLPTNYKNLALVASLSLILTLLTYTKLKPAAQAFVVILISTSLGSAAYALYDTGASMSRFSGLSSSDNVIILSFDGTAGNVAKQAIEDSPELKQAFKDFIFYDNAVSLAPATVASLRSEIYGNINFRELSELSSDLPAKMVDYQNSIKREQSTGSDVMTYGPYSFFNESSSDIIIPGTLTDSNFIERSSIALSFYPHIAARIGTPELAKLIDTQLRLLQKNYLHDVKAERATVHQGAAWDALSTLQNEEVTALIKNLHTTDSKRTVRYMHFLHTHFPVDFDENCTYRSNSKEWFDANQNYQGLKNETHCALQQTADFIQKLKDLNIYDKTTFIVKSDHGALAPNFDYDPDGISFNGQPLWGYNRYRPLLMFKSRAAEQDSLIYNNALVSLSDLAKTLCLQSTDKRKCDDFKGLDLLNTEAEDTSPKLYFDVVKDATSSHDYDTQMTVVVPRERDFLAALKNTGKITFTASEMTQYLQRKRDLEEIRTALEKYREAKGSYPPSQAFDGLYSIWGSAAQNWIPGLVPTFLSTLPRDPQLSKEATPQYIYRSNGAAYKLISHGANASCKIALRDAPQLVDPRRNCFGFGFWSPGAEGW
ncbi:sulfatase-like hydrolase/transferase [Pseudomonas proteolytica]|uniref:sulfatase-like hydrolase/transferase n=1 Tax=Pseudomonas proteolytica TaxID=219574 RepID=UPI0023DFE236|nr:sulfatase-like hydrolase/transferase [Pseudomonas proteolytica]MDF3162404.1 sulfatase-like hydrolase/transferase [Pseudomonas proteolytica]